MSRTKRNIIANFVGNGWTALMSLAFKDMSGLKMPQTDFSDVSPFGMSKLSKNIIYNFVGQSVLLVLGFLSVKYVYKLLGEDALGIIYFAATLNVILCGVLEKGLNATTVREISSHYGTDSDYIRDFLRTGAALCFVIYIFFVVLVYIATPVLVEKWINLKSMDAGTAVDILRILGISSLLAFPRSFYASAFRGLQRMEFNNVIDVAISFLQQAGTIVILMAGGGVYAVAGWFGFCYFTGVLSYAVAASFFFPGKALLPGFSTDVFRKIKGFAARTASISVLAVVHKQVDKVVMSKMLTIGMVGYFGFAYGTASKAGIIVSAVSNAAYPSFSELFKSGDSEGLKRQYLKLQEFISLATVPVFAAVIFAAIPLTTYLFNEDVARTLFLPFLFLGIGFYLNGTLNLLYQLTLAVGRPDIGMRSNFYALFIVTPLTVLLSYYFGTTGAALSWIVFNVYVYIYFLPIVCREFFRENLLRWYLKEMRFFAIAIFGYGAVWAALRHAGTFGLIGFSAAYLAGTMVFLSVAVFFINEDLRISIIGNLRKTFGVVNAG